MLRNVLVDYLNGVKEREFDFPFLSLLFSMGFHDIHFTHGIAEFGKDFIAKKEVDGTAYQYSFQSKAGDITQADWRNDILGQMLEGIMVTRSHPCFDTNIPHQSILVITGRLTGNAPISFAQFNQQVKKDYNALPIDLWDRERLVNYLEEYGLTGIHYTTANGFANYADFYSIYARTLQGKLSIREIERYSQNWNSSTINREYPSLVCVIESEIIARKCLDSRQSYEAVYVYLASLRAVLQDIYNDQDNEIFTEIYNQGLLKLKEIAISLFDTFQDLWVSTGKSIVATGNTTMMTYLVHCARIVEIAGLAYFLETDSAKKVSIIEFIKEFTLKEAGVGHIPGDRYAVSLVLPVLALCDYGALEGARGLIHRATVWLCNRYSEGFGLAAFDDDEITETKILLGYPFEFIDVKPYGDSFFASVLSDLAAFTGDKELYKNVVSDIKAAKIFPTYWSVPDSKAIFSIEAEDIVTYPNTEHDDSLSSFDLYQFAEHIKKEPRSYELFQNSGAISFVILMLVLRERYFPTIWPLLAKLHPLT